MSTTEREPLTEIEREMDLADRADRCSWSMTDGIEAWICGRPGRAVYVKTGTLSVWERRLVRCAGHDRERYQRTMIEQGYERGLVVLPGDVRRTDREVAERSARQDQRRAIDAGLALLPFPKSVR